MRLLPLPTRQTGPSKAIACKPSYVAWRHHLFSLMAAASISASLSLLGGAASAEAPTPKHELVWHEDHFDEASAQARKASQQVILKFWAPWCHSCLSMKHHVLPNADWSEYRKKLLWTSINTDLKENSAVTERFHIRVWPTFIVYDPVTHKEVLRHEGSASVDELKGLLDLAVHAPTPAEQAAWAAIQQAQNLSQQSQHKQAAQRYEQILTRLDSKHRLRPLVIKRILKSHLKDGAYQVCSQKAALLKETGFGVTALDAAFAAWSCVEQGTRAYNNAHSKFSSLQIDRYAQGQIKEHVRKLLTQSKGLAVDDRSEAHRLLRNIYLHSGTTQLAQQTARKQRSLLLKAIQNAASPTQAAAYNWNLLEVANFLKTLPEDITWLERSAKALPTDYDPSYRYASALTALNRPQAALHWSQQAAKQSEGMIHMRVQLQLANILQSLKQKNQEKKIRKDLIKNIRASGLHKQSPKWAGILTDQQNILAAM